LRKKGCLETTLRLPRGRRWDEGGTKGKGRGNRLQKEEARKNGRKDVGLTLTDEFGGGKTRKRRS